MGRTRGAQVYVALNGRNRTLGEFLAHLRALLLEHPEILHQLLDDDVNKQGGVFGQ
jgi:hypothetical protein